jgi:ligand-binding sensor domain-containing protein
MKKVFFTLLFFLVACLSSCSQKKYTVIPGMHVYNVKQHNDSIYFSTLNNGIFRFHPDNPGTVQRCAGSGQEGFRSILFFKGKLFAASNEMGVYYADNDTMLPLASAPYPAWSIKLDEHVVLWLAGSRGIFLDKNDTSALFKFIPDAHDIAFCRDKVFVAHRLGISTYDKVSGTLEKEWCKGNGCWSVTSYDSLIVGGGTDKIVIIDKETGYEIPFGPRGNVLWCSARDRTGTIFCGTQRGLYCIGPDYKKATYAGLRNTCIKSLLIDKNGTVWVGRFSKK